MHKRRRKMGCCCIRYRRKRGADAYDKEKKGEKGEKDADA
jgi:hypothetical protein